MVEHRVNFPAALQSESYVKLPFVTNKPNQKKKKTIPVTAPLDFFGSSQGSPRQAPVALTRRRLMQIRCLMPAQSGLAVGNGGVMLPRLRKDQHKEIYIPGFNSE